MKIRPSLRLYVLLAMLLTGVSTILVLSYMSLNYFFSGMDLALRGNMYSLAAKQSVSPGDPVHIEKFTIATRWEDLPLEVRNNLSKKGLEYDELRKKAIGHQLLSPPDAVYFVMKVRRGEEDRFISAHFTQDGIHTQPKVLGMPHFVYIILTALGSIAFFSLVLVLIMRKVAAPVEALGAWAKGLDSKDKLAAPAPDFHYSELNTLAGIVQSSLSSVQESLDREQRFLGYASHELRTPIAVTRTNSELLRKMVDKGLDKEKQLAVLERIERAGLTMTDLTETLLWLNRQEEKSLPVTEVSPGTLCEEISEELGYLLQGKQVEVSLKRDGQLSELPEALCRIVISNLIRNAFQHTSEGRVSIVQRGLTLTITNQNLGTTGDEEFLGFGLGLELTERLIGRYGWQQQVTMVDGGRKVSVDFTAPTAE